MSFWDYLPPWMKPGYGFTPESLAGPKPEPPEVDDWVEKTSNWGEREVCHCGQSRRDWRAIPTGLASFVSQSYTYDVCPKCGHKDKWEKFVCRDVWEESPARQAYWEDRYKSGSMWKDWHRNERVERWTPEHCPVKD